LTQRLPRTLCCTAGAFALLLTLGACATASTRETVATTASAPGTAPSSAVQNAATAAAAATPEQSPPTTVASVPNGIYRTDFGQAGSSTLTIKAGKYDLACGDTGDCGGTPLKWRPYVDVGTLRGTRNSVWFVPDPALKSRLTGCIRHSQAATGCGAEDPYSFTWRLTSKGLSFQNFFGLGDQAGQADGYLNFTAKPWTKIQ
jgi:hypothetical protein